MRRISILLTLPLLALAASAGDCVAQGMTRVQRIQGSDQRGRYDIAWVRLTERFPNAAVRARVNADLEREARSHICDRAPDRERRRHYEAEYEMKVTYLSPRLLGISTREFISCGGAHPNHGPGALLYDLRTGRQLVVENQVADPEAFGRFVARRALAARPRNPGECVDAYTLDPLGETVYIYLLKNRTLTAIQDYPHVMKACAYETEIPHADIVRFLKPGSPLRALVVRRP
ncbi:MAG TPA: hypothetical protein VGB15_18830 [Longimicrobium sp.]|jgi:hypothetical protein